MNALHGKTKYRTYWLPFFLRTKDHQRITCDTLTHDVRLTHMIKYLRPVLEIRVNGLALSSVRNIISIRSANQKSYKFYYVQGFLYVIIYVTASFMINYDIFILCIIVFEGIPIYCLVNYTAVIE